MDWKKLGKKLLFPPVWLTVLLTLCSAAGLAWSFATGREQSAVAYIVYALSFYSLTVLCLFCALVLPKRWAQLKEKIYANPWGNRYMTDGAFRTRFSMYLSLWINLLFVCVNLLLWQLAQSWWYVVMAGYHGILAFLWALLAGYIRSNPAGSNLPREWKRSRTCACVLLLINLFLSGAVLMILYRNKGTHYDGILIYVMALFTFYSATTAIVDIIRYRALESPVLSMAKVVSLSAALVSMLNLETAMFAQFGGDMAPEDRRLFIILTGAGVSIAVVSLSSLLIIKATKEIRREKYGK